MRAVGRVALRSSKTWRVAFLALVAGAIALTGLLGPASARQGQAAAPQTPDYSKAEVHILPVQGNIYMLVGAGGNITVQVGDDGVLLVDAGLAPMSEKVLAAVRSLSDKPIRYIINTHVHADHTGGNETIAKAGKHHRRRKCGGRYRCERGKSGYGDRVSIGA